jgi:hypothetical protein
MNPEAQKLEAEWLAMRARTMGELLALKFQPTAGPATKVFVEMEIERRAMLEAVRVTMKAARWQAYFGIAGVVVGVLLTKLLDLLK